MGKRSRKRGVSAEEPLSPSGSTRAERDAARARRARTGEDRGSARSGGSSEERPRASLSAAPRRRGRPGMDERPPAPWGKFPLVELVVLVSIGLFIAAFIVQGQRGAVMLMAGLALGSLAGLELSIREHFGGFRSHTTLLAGAAAFAAMVIVFFAGGRGDVARVLLLPVGGIVFVAAFWLLREAFKRRSGGLGFR